MCSAIYDMNYNIINNNAYYYYHYYKKTYKYLSLLITSFIIIIINDINYYINYAVQLNIHFLRISLIS